ncbi:MAG: hypothetical protein FJ403_17985 [Verrucomicrobia bacterium]|nr:hypothetical protein [Verrucomicrobiota bacterium]
MNDAPIDLALRHLSETRNILALLITSSESFDYPKAKEALGKLQRKMKELGDAQAALVTLWQPADNNVMPVRFPERGARD